MFQAWWLVMFCSALRDFHQSPRGSSAGGLSSLVEEMTHPSPSFLTFRLTLSVICTTSTFWPSGWTTEGLRASTCLFVGPPQEEAPGVGVVEMLLLGLIL